MLSSHSKYCYPCMDGQAELASVAVTVSSSSCLLGLSSWLNTASIKVGGIARRMAKGDSTDHPEL